MAQLLGHLHDVLRCMPPLLYSGQGYLPLVLMFSRKPRVHAEGARHGPGGVYSTHPMYSHKSRVQSTSTHGPRVCSAALSFQTI